MNTKRLRTMDIPQLQKRYKVLKTRWAKYDKETREMKYIKWHLRKRKKA